MSYGERETSRPSHLPPAPPPSRRGDAITVSHFPLDTARETQRDSRNIDRNWRRWKALHLIQTEWLLARLLSRRP